MCAIVSVSMTVGLILHAFNLVDLLPCSVMLLQLNTGSFMAREPYFRVLNNWTREAY